jgi:hypothetical protein
VERFALLRFGCCVCVWYELSLLSSFALRDLVRQRREEMEKGKRISLLLSILCL